MEAYQERVVKEKIELDEKLVNLRKFFTSTTFARISEQERDRLNRQEKVMHEYSLILAERIANF